MRPGHSRDFRDSFLIQGFLPIYLDIFRELIVEMHWGFAWLGGRDALPARLDRPRLRNESLKPLKCPEERRKR